MTALIRIDDEAGFLASLDQAKRFLAACSSLDEAKAFRDKSLAIETWAKARGDARELEGHARALRVRAEIRMGELLPPPVSNAQAGAESRGGKGKDPRSHVRTAAPLSKQEASRLRNLAATVADEPGVPDVKERAIEKAKADEGRASTRAVLKAASEIKRQARETRMAERQAARPIHAPAAVSETDESLTLEAMVERGDRFSTIYADPPWDYDHKGTRGTMANHYPGMSLEAICALPVAKLAAKDAHLHLWTTSVKLPLAFAVIEAWGFRYCSSLIWTKPQMGMGNYWRVSHELLLLGVRGSLEFARHDVLSYLSADRTEHSTKPQAFRTLVESVSPGPRLELFAREAAPGWTCWGNQVARAST